MVALASYTLFSDSDKFVVFPVNYYSIFSIVAERGLRHAMFMEQADSPDSAYIALAIKTLRKEKKLSQRRLSWAAKISEETIYLLEYRKTNARLDTLQRIAKALETTLDGLIVKGKELYEPVPKTARQILSENVKKYRKAGGITQEILAYRSGISVATVLKIESCRSSATIDTVFSIAATLGVSPSHLLDDLENGVKNTQT